MNFTKYFSGKKVLVTGGSGFIGSKLCQALSQYNAEVHGTYFKTLISNHDFNIHWWKCDLENFDATHKIVSSLKPDYIFHLASHVAGSRNLDLVLPAYHSNLTSSINLLTSATRVGCQRFIITGSMEEPDNEDQNIIPSSPYAAAKWAASAYSRMFFKLYQTPIIIARLFMVYGPGQKDLNKLIPYTILSHFKNQNPDFASGLRQVDWVFIDDVVTGLIKMAICNNIEGQTIDIGSGKTLSIKEIIHLLLKVLESNIVPNFGGLPDRPMENIKIARTGETYSKLNWKPEISLKEGLKITADWYKQQYT